VALSEHPKPHALTPKIPIPASNVFIGPQSPELHENSPKKASAALSGYLIEYRHSAFVRLHCTFDERPTRSARGARRFASFGRKETRMNQFSVVAATA
jgi:hypothetical protein